MQLKITYFLIGCLAVFLFCEAMGQSSKGKVIDAVTRQGIPFAQIIHYPTQIVQIADVKGHFNLIVGDSTVIRHPFYTKKIVTLHKYDSLFSLEPNSKTNRRSAE